MATIKTHISKRSVKTRWKRQRFERDELTNRIEWFEGCLETKFGYVQIYQQGYNDYGRIVITFEVIVDRKLYMLELNHRLFTENGLMRKAFQFARDVYEGNITMI